MFKRESAASDPDATRPEQDGAAEPTPPGLGVRYVSHPASLPNAPCPLPPPPAPASAPPWSPRERFAPPGPDRVAMPLLDMTLPPDPSPPAMRPLDATPEPPPPARRSMFTAAAVEEHEPSVPMLAVTAEPEAAPAPVRPRPAEAPDDKLASLWAADPVDPHASPAPAAMPSLRGRRLALAVGGVAAILLAGGAVAMLLSRQDALVAAPSIGSIYNAPMMVLRASLAGQVREVAVQAGQVVGPDTPLLTVHTARADADFAVLPHVNGIVRSLEVQAGAEVAPGAPLVRVLDCDHAFLTLAAGAALRAGQSVLVRLPDLPAVTATVRDSAGLAEPLDALVVPLPAAALGGACPVGGSALVSLAAGGG